MNRVRVGRESGDPVRPTIRQFLDSSASGQQDMLQLDSDLLHVSQLRGRAAERAGQEETR